MPAGAAAPTTEALRRSTFVVVPERTRTWLDWDSCPFFTPDCLAHYFTDAFDFDLTTVGV